MDSRKLNNQNENKKLFQIFRGLENLSKIILEKKNGNLFLFCYIFSVGVKLHNFLK